MRFLSVLDVEGSLILKICVFQLILSPDVMSLNTVYLRLCLSLFKTLSYMEHLKLTKSTFQTATSAKAPNCFKACS